jgi:magnesium chelatase family protein
VDRIDIQIEVPAVPYKELRAGEVTEASAGMRARVEKAREIQRARGSVNSRTTSRLIRQQCALDETGERTLEMAMKRVSLSARAHDRILKVARTIADLDESPSIAAKHIAEAIQYRTLDRNCWS